VDLLTIYIVAIIVLGAIVVAINIRLMRREEGNADEEAASVGSSEGQPSEAMSDQAANFESAGAPAVPQDRDSQPAASAGHDEALVPTKTAADVTAQETATPIFQRRSHPASESDRATMTHPARALDKALQLEQARMRMSDEDYRNALRRLSRHVTSDNTLESDDQQGISSDDAYREALRSMTKNKQD
jgi:hypothetical protein